MLEDKVAAPDGVTSVPLAAGEVYELPDWLAARYVDRGVGEVAKAAAAVKDAGAAPENKTAKRGKGSK